MFKKKSLSRQGDKNIWFSRDPKEAVNTITKLVNQDPKLRFVILFDEVHLKDLSGNNWNYITRELVFTQRKFLRCSKSL